MELVVRHSGERITKSMIDGDESLNADDADRRDEALGGGVPIDGKL
jgi:hypothetical protein